VEKITLKPAIKELIHRNGEDGSHFDVLTYHGSNNQEKSLGSLVLVGHIKYTEDDLSYAINLISSLAKREFYGEESVLGQDTKRAFGSTLGKLNEVLDDLFKNKSLKLNIGLMAISGDNVFISRLGKFKVALARDSKPIDVLNNIELFNKDAEDVKQFSNIISGKLYPGDKIFAYFPTRSLVAREKQLQEILVQEDQESFKEKIASLAVNASNFSCCGVHVLINELKELPVQTVSYTKPLMSIKPQSDDLEDEEEVTTSTPKIDDDGDPEEQPLITRAQNKYRDEAPENEAPRIIPAEFSINKKITPMTSLTGYFRKMGRMNKLSSRVRSKMFFTIATLVVLPVIGIVVFRSMGGSSELKTTINEAKEKVKLAQMQLTQNNTREARNLLQAAISTAAGLSNDKINEVKDEAMKTLNNINRFSDKNPELYSDLSSAEGAPSFDLISENEGTVFTLDNVGGLHSIKQDNPASKISRIEIQSGFIYSLGSLVSVFNGSDSITTVNLETNKSSSFSLKEPSQVSDATIYEGNLYALAENKIYKYADAVTGGTKKTTWSTETPTDNLISITADGNLFVLTETGKIIKYFKGAKESEFDLNLSPTTGSRIFTHKDSAFIYLTDKSNGFVYVFDKASGELKTTYNISSVGSIKTFSISPDGSVWALSSDNKIWVVR